VARAARYGAWRAGPHGRVPSFPDVRTEDAHALVREFFHAAVGGGWMPPEVTAGLLRCYGIPLAGSTAPGGIEVVVRVEDDHLFGALVVFGLGGLGTGALADHAARLTPLTDVDADQLIRSIRAAPLLLGQHGSESVDVGALRDLLLRVSRLADDLPEVTELDLNPVITRADGVFVTGARIRATPYRPQDPFLRKLR
jgi:acyl-CoA synthetase (NDP forming)